MKVSIVMVVSLLVLMIQWSDIHAFPSPIETFANFFKCTALHLSEQCLDLAYRCLLLANPWKCFKTLKCAELSLAQCTIIE
ncbi:uncharacterized protein LOC113797361 isoform X2 [Dermatophagoides pteronyssinus]|uniref:Uncharacterized protein LOC113797402 n=1 Tax=Dermatophagoides pteronyssinus TaxID=6956 RepID=A0A6P6YFK3_DERPT|nr:uncharacterized protein LOC113797402 [Dermatophagoides pteronyssinus]